MILSEAYVEKNGVQVKECHLFISKADWGKTSVGFSDSYKMTLAVRKSWLRLDSHPGDLEDGGSWRTAEELLLCWYLSLSPGLGTGQGNGMAIMGLDKEAGDGIEFLTNRDSI